MAIKNRKKTSKGRFNILLMRSQGEVLNLAVSPFMLVVAFLFAIVFVVASINIMNRYFTLVLEYRDLSSAYKETADELGRLQSLYTYQASVADDYTNLMQALNRADPQQTPEAEEPPANSGQSGAAAPENGAAGAGDSQPAAGDESGATEAAGAETPEPEVAGLQPPLTLEEWANRLPDVAAQPEQRLNIDRLQVTGGRFSFALLNDDPGGRAAQGRLLLLFAVETQDGAARLVAFPDFDTNAAEPDFEMGPGYNIRAGKTVDGRIDLPPGGVVKGVMAAAKSRAGNIVMKKLLPLGE